MLRYMFAGVCRRYKAPEITQPYKTKEDILLDLLVRIDNKVGKAEFEVEGKWVEVISRAHVVYGYKAVVYGKIHVSIQGHQVLEVVSRGQSSEYNEIEWEPWVALANKVDIYTEFLTKYCDRYLKSRSDREKYVYGVLTEALTVEAKKKAKKVGL